MIFRDLLERIKSEDPYLYLFSRFIYYSSMRQDAELYSLKIYDIDLYRRVILVSIENSKKKKIQYSPMDDEFLEIIINMKLERLIKLIMFLPHQQSLAQGLHIKDFFENGLSERKNLWV